MRVDLSSRLLEVDWSRLEHAYGLVTDLPELLHEIGGAEHPEDSLGMLRDRLVHQGHVLYSATVEAVPILVDMSVAGDRFARPAIVRLIGDIAREAARVAAEQETKARWSRMWRAVLPRMVELLDDDDAAVRRVASLPLASAEFDQDRLVERLLHVSASERDEPARLGQLVAVADLLPSASAAVRAAAVGTVAEIVPGGSPQVRMAGALVLRQAGPVGVDVFLDALRAPEVERWRLTWCVPGRRASIVRWVDERLGEDRDLRSDLGRGLLGSAGAATRSAGLTVLMTVASRWRTSMEDVTGALDDPDPAVSTEALFALAVWGSPDPGLADRFAELAEGPGGYPRLAGVWGLARLGDSRCVPHLLAALRPGRFDYPTHQVHEGPVSRPVLPSVDELLLEAAPWCETLLPGVVQRLAGAPDGAERRALLRTVIGWGPSGGAALPMLVDGLGRQDPTLEIIALAATGARGHDVPIDLLRSAFARASAVPGVDRVKLIRAYTGITADFAPVLAELPDPGSAEPLSESALHVIGAIGTAGAEYADRIERLLPELGRWATLGAARSHWEITGEPGVGGRALTRLLVDLEAGRPAVAADLVALKRIAEMGFSDPVLSGVLRFLAGTEARVTGPANGWRDIDLDRKMAGTARRLLDGGQ